MARSLLQLTSMHGSIRRLAAYALLGMLAGCDHRTQSDEGTLWFFAEDIRSHAIVAGLTRNNPVLSGTVMCGEVSADAIGAAVGEDLLACYTSRIDGPASL